MTKSNSSARNKKLPPQNILSDSSPDTVLDTTDAGDDTQRRFSYQHAYGVILLLAAISGKKPYTAIWCEHHEDLLGQRDDGSFDAYQIKTQRSESWNLSSPALKKSIKRFFELDQRFPGKFKNFFFVSNASYENSNAQDKIERNPIKFLEAIKHATSPDDLTPPFNTALEKLCTYCDCEPLQIIELLKKLDLISGPGLDSFEAEIAQNHLPAIEECVSLSASALTMLLNELIALVYRASSLSVRDPARHWQRIIEGGNDNPTLQEKRITPASIHTFIHNNRLRFLHTTKDAYMLSDRLEETLKFYLIASFKVDKDAKFDQAGDVDPDRTTLLRQIFIDLELKPRSDQPRPPHRLEQRQLAIFEEVDQIAKRVPSGENKPLSAMDCFLKEVSPKIVIIGGPGQGKSTLGQYLAQVHRSILLQREMELSRDIVEKRATQKTFHPATVRIPFRIILKDFAQWLADRDEEKPRKGTNEPILDTVEAYIAEQIGKGASRPKEIEAPMVQEILKARPTLLIFDGLDEVNEPTLCQRMLLRIEQFLEQVEQFRADMQVIATSRPTGYSDQFSPRQFWHLELLPMSVKKVEEYAKYWIAVKESNDAEQQRIKKTLEECLKAEHTHLLLTTPLQVTIILLIIKDGGRPPSEREALFQQYWITILNREKKKAGGIIRTSDTLLFDLHAYLGYLLHDKSASGNVLALLTAEEFKQILYDFLRLTDQISSSETIQQKAAVIVEETRKRLVLLVEPEPDLFGFELRSLQEFFAGAYLAQTARDTQQRFERLKAIAYSKHWRNVALFFIGRIVRSFGGEVIRILDVCRPIDHDLPDTYLHRGAWLALDIAADGIFTENNRNLQQSVLDIALVVLETGMTDQEQRQLADALQRLSQDDLRDILSKLLKQKLSSLSPSCLPPALEIYGQFIGTQQNFIQALEILLSTNKQEYILKALGIGFRHKVKPTWLAQQLEKYWHFWVEEKESLALSPLWYLNPQYTQKVFLALSLSEEQSSDLMDYFLRIKRAVDAENDINIIDGTITLKDQMLVLLQCLSAIYYYQTRRVNSETVIHIMLNEKIQIASLSATKMQKIANNELKVKIERIITCADLMPQLRVCLWILYWYTHEPTDSIVETFLAESRIWLGNQVIATFLQNKLRRYWPIIDLALEKQMNDDLHAVTLLQPYLNSSQTISIGQQVGNLLQKKLSKLSGQEQLATILSYHYPVNDYPELASIAKKMGIDVSKLIDMYISTSITANRSLSSTTLQKIFSYIEEDFAQFQKPLPELWLLVIYNWDLNHNVAHLGMRLLHNLVERLSQCIDVLQECLIIFLKLLLSFDAVPLTMAPAILSLLTEEIFLGNLLLWCLHPVQNLFDSPLRVLVDLVSFTTHEDVKVQQGAIILWSKLLEVEFSRRPTERSLPLELNFNLNLCLSLIKSTDVIQRKKGILLLTYSHFPISKEKHNAELRELIAKPHDSDEMVAWPLFLRNVPISKAERKDWLKLLETILASPQMYTTRILAAAMERYTNLIGEAKPEIKDKHALGLPPLAHSKKKRTRK
jgi:Cap4 dsDNA endonuclease